MKKILLLISITASFNLFAQNITTKFEQSNGTQTPTYFEIVDWWKKLDEKSWQSENAYDGHDRCRVILCI
jgi:hypothetical protein